MAESAEVPAAAADKRRRSCTDRGALMHRERDPGLSCRSFQFVRYSCMATRTITLELDAYEKLRAAKKGGESFSEVVRRAAFADAPLTGEDLRTHLRSGGSGVSERYLNALEEAAFERYSS